LLAQGADGFGNGVDLAVEISMKLLVQIHADIDSRIQAIQSEHRDWLCRLGCDSCCRRLAEIPRLTAAEWDWLRAGLSALLPQDIKKIARNVAVLASQASRPIVCPMLDQTIGACRVYTHRPVACRTYGFYVERDLGLYCNDIESRVAAGGWADVVWGNQASIERRLGALGDTRELTEWFAQWEATQGDASMPSDEQVA
jgi:Fe-S-cluster containining protein